jgi:hypothetical protein
VNIVLSTRSFSTAAGSETYLLTLAEQLQRLGHEITIFAEETGPMGDFATSRGTIVVTRPESLPDRCDALVVQDGVVAYTLAERYPATPQLFVSHSELHDLQLPPGLAGVIAGAVVLSDRVERRIRQLASHPPVHRLRQPIDTERFMPAGALPAKPRKAVLLGNYLRGQRLESIRAALRRRGIESELVGANTRSTLTPEHAIWDADIVVAKGRAALEGMACGKAVFVYDHFGGDGWVTAEAYPALEADAFAGLARSPVATPAQLDDELASYDQDMGTVNRELVLSHHGARGHAADLSSLLGHPGEPVLTEGAPLRELARLVRLQWLTEARAINFEEAARHAREDADRARSELESVHDELARLTSELALRREFEQTRRVRWGVAVGTAFDSARQVISSR